MQTNSLPNGALGDNEVYIFCKLTIVGGVCGGKGTGLGLSPQTPAHLRFFLPTCAT